jgi:hypothetical protein
MEQQVWSLPRASRSTLRPRVAVPSPHNAFQEHAAHMTRWPVMLGSKGSSSTCIPEVLRHSYAVLHGAPSSWCTQLSWAPTTMPHPTPMRTSGISLGSRLPTPHCPSHASQVSRVHNAGLKRNAVGGVLLNAPSPLWGSPIFLQGKVRLTWSPMRSHPMKEAWVPALHTRRMAGSTG